MSKDNDDKKRKHRFQYDNYSLVEWCEEFIKNGKVMRARIPKTDPCSLKCGKRISKDQHYYVGRSWNRIAHKECVDRLWNQHLAQKTGEEALEVQKKKDAEWRAQEKLRAQKGIIPMPEVTSVSESSTATPAVIVTGAATRTAPERITDNIELMVELEKVRGEYRGFMLATEMFLRAQSHQQPPRHADIEIQPVKRIAQDGSAQET